MMSNLLQGSLVYVPWDVEKASLQAVNELIWVVSRDADVLFIAFMICRKGATKAHNMFILPSKANKDAFLCKIQLSTAQILA